MSEVATSVLGDGRTAVAGLTWIVAPRGIGLAQARLTGRTAKASGFLLRAEGRNLAVLPPPLQASQSVALGDVLCQALGPSWCGVFSVHGKSVYVAANEGFIPPDGDQLYPNERAARARLEEEAILYTKVYAPSSWGIEGAADSDAILRALDWSRASVFAPLKTSSRARTRTPLLIGVLMVAVGFAGYEFRQVRKVKAEQEALAKKPPPPVDPWRIKARPEQAAAACLAVRSAIAGVTRQGWDVTALSCDFSAHMATATLTAFTSSSKLPALGQPFAFQLSADGASLLVTAPIGIAPFDRIAERPVPTAFLAARNFLVSSATDNAPTWQANGGRAQFEITQTLPVGELATGLGRFPTASINRLDYSGGTWRVQGEIYE